MQYGVYKEIDGVNLKVIVHFVVIFDLADSVPVCHLHNQIDRNKATEVFISIHRWDVQKGFEKYGIYKEI